MSRVHIIPNFLTKQECTTVLVECKNNLELKQAVIGSKPEVDLKFRKSSVAFIKDLGIVNTKLMTQLTELVKIKGFNISELERFQFTEYQVGEFYNWHRDSATDSPKYAERFYSTVIQLNDDYTDGELEIIMDRKENSLPKGLGTLYLFPSNFMHRVKPISSGIRYSLVNWIKLNKDLNTKSTLI